MEYNFDKLREMCGGDEVFFKELIDTFIESTEETLKEIRNAIEKKDQEKLSYWAHRIKSNLKMLDSTSLETKARIIEEWPDSDELLWKMADGFVKEIAVLNQEIKASQLS